MRVTPENRPDSPKIPYILYTYEKHPNESMSQDFQNQKWQENFLNLQKNQETPDSLTHFIDSLKMTPLIIRVSTTQEVSQNENSE